MTEKFRLPPRQSNTVKPSIIVKPQPEPVYKNENFQIGVITGVISTIVIILFCLMIIGLIGAILS